MNRRLVLAAVSTTLVILALPAAALATAGIRGTVTDVHGDPIFNTRVYAMVPVAGSPGAYDQAGFADTNAAGVYYIGKLPERANYRVLFGGQNVISEWWNDKPEMEESDPVAIVGSTNTLGIDAVVSVHPKVTGTVTGPGGEPTAGVQVRTWAAGRQADYGSGFTAADGSYSFSTLAGVSNFEKSIKLEFIPPKGTPYLGEFHLNKSSFAAADAFALGPDDVLRADAKLAAAGTIAGRVTGGAGQGLGGLSVRVYGRSQAQATTAADGSYALRGLPSGRYRLLVTGDDLFATEWWDSKLAEAAATPIDVAAGEVDTIDPVLLRWPVVTGQLTDGERPMEGVVVALVYSTGNGGPMATTDENGVYRISKGVVPGRYRVGFYPSWITGDGESFYGGTTFASATPITVAPEAVVSGIDGVISSAGHVGGKVTGPGGAPLAGVRVVLYEIGGTPIRSVTTTATGTYSFSPVGTRDYRIGFLPSDGLHGSEYHDDSPTLAGSDLVTAEPNLLTTVDAQLQPLGTATISGRITRTDGAPVHHADVDVLDPASGEAVRGTRTAADGTYIVTGLDDGAYRVRFSAPSPTREYPDEDRPADAGYLETEYYDNVKTLEPATTLTLADGQALGGIDASLTPTGTIAGTVTSDVTTLRDARVHLIRSDGLRAGPFLTRSDGTYQARGLRPGSWKVYVASPYSAYRGEYYDDGASLEDATAIAVSARSTVGGIDAALEPASSPLAAPAFDGTRAFDAQPSW